ncbi:molecular chaperone [Massilia sp. GCM10020059]|uniref:Fimbria/pilus periplasmic chaperone n=1 Tax=Massilia agrisoli TaxID=2892444 RepID=A0ABS8IUM7_9BURK|nr:fimbria/pilus periplasmic chaperone [Massilia agrisoli]MCC6072269.1 fimbria/pilus periplasmic chaperone [Massilia agrisoli]
MPPIVLAQRARRLLLPCLFALAAQSAHAELMLHPTRIVFDKNDRAAQVELINNSREAATYRITLVNRRMTEDGRFEPVAAPVAGELFADPMLRYSPRQVTLQPGTAQTVRLMLRKPAVLAEGEYRSHLHFEKLPAAAGSTSIEAHGKPGDIGVKLNALVGASMPVIVRHGAVQGTVSLSQLALHKAEAGRAPMLALQFDRLGNGSVYGDVQVTFTPQGGAPQVLATAGGIAVYSPNAVRRATLPLQVPQGVALARGALDVVFRQRADAGGAVLARAALPLP